MFGSWYLNSSVTHMVMSSNFQAGYFSIAYKCFISLWDGLKDFRFVMNFGMITGADCESNCAQYICGML